LVVRATGHVYLYSCKRDGCMTWRNNSSRNAVVWACIQA
jgi:hypothetical protein